MGTVTVRDDQIVQVVQGASILTIIFKEKIISEKNLDLMTKTNKKGFVSQK